MATSRIFLISLPVLYLTLLHSEQPKLHRVLGVLSAIGLKAEIVHYYALHTYLSNRIVIYLANFLQNLEFRIMLEHHVTNNFVLGGKLVARHMRIFQDKNWF